MGILLMFAIASLHLLFLTLGCVACIFNFLIASGVWHNVSHFLLFFFFSYHSFKFVFFVSSILTV